MPIEPQIDESDLLSSGWTPAPDGYVSPRTGKTLPADAAIPAEKLHRIVEETVGRELRALEAIERMP